MLIIVIYLCLCLAVGWSAGKTKLGSTSAFLLSLLLSPLIGFIVVLFYSEKKNESAAPTLAAPSTLADELAKLKALKDSNHLSELEYEKAKAKLLG